MNDDDDEDIIMFADCSEQNTHKMRQKWNKTYLKQETQLSQRDRATLRVIEYFAKSLKKKIIQGHSKW